MTLASMTGFARASGVYGVLRWAWELKSVNSKGLDLRFRLPPGRDVLEPAIRASIAKVLNRGNVTINLTINREGAAPQVRINEDVLAAVVAASKSLAGKIDAQKPTLDGILSIKGVMEVVETEESEAEREAANRVLLAGFETALKDLVEMRGKEGDVIGGVLSDRVTEIEKLTSRAESSPSRSIEAIRAKLGEQVKELLSASPAFDPERLHQEAALIAAKADIREELDRLMAHVGAARALLKGGGSVGRKLDFLAQEFNRESNTLCSKSNDVALTAIGLELKTAVDQFREQVQNIE
ncbi:MAG: YicC family protein [Xanthobacteraceae bacterium]|nr:YicC family protein [Xanthobacteraceae bacterium]MBX3548721.1 YicC family protein [Xanthobacteraceae bacterium]MCW5674355.1 YicC family protein [Xanthobacteraceae bacterium]MCW5678671.1 YicC family protein [Xanthobacteraceae bacterium]